LGWGLNVKNFRNLNQKELDFGVFFSSSINAPADRKTGFHANQDKQRIRGMERLRTLNSYQIFKIKN
jgi:hypothetical protein